MIFRNMFFEVRRPVKSLSALRALEGLVLVMAVDVVFELAFRHEGVITQRAWKVLDTIMRFHMYF